ncbi:MAG: type-F conjugative transfer system protein TraW [Candidatus Paracaedibacteraceae bacterium]|nr:type-F conjugative transfer system protein TraW [Candidatus Paracaedibacteraceae bacterium]
MTIKALAVAVTFISSHITFAKDLGTFSQVFEIKEKSLLEVIQEKLQHLSQTGAIEKHQQELQKRVQQTIERPHPMVTVQKVTTPSTKLYDPSIVVKEDIKDHKNQIIVRQGEVYNPLDDVNFGEPLLFIDGDDPAQVEWALKQPGKKVLVKGSPIQLMKQYNQTFYFDQGSLLLKKLDIHEVPARISQQGKKLLIEMIAID